MRLSLRLILTLELFIVTIFITSLVSSSVLNLSKHTRLLDTYNAQRPKSCQGQNGTLSGQCLFVWHCYKSDGKSLGLCQLDNGIYGTCCYHNGTSNEVTEDSGVDYSSSPSEELEEIPQEVVPQSECGVSDFQPQVPENETLASRHSPEFRIVGGNPASVGQWPWVVSVRRASLFGYSTRHSCGGVVVNENWVATAAHCVASLSKSLIRVRLGDLDFKSELDTKIIPSVERKIVRKVIYPTYNASSYENDLALLQLSEPIIYSPNVRPLCLPPQGGSDYIGDNGVIVGWGRISEKGHYSQKQLYVNVPIISNKDCVQMFRNSGRNERIPAHFICAGYAIGGKDGCQGDSGGPLTVKDPNGRWSLVGIMSWGIGCGEPQQPGVYTRISLFTNWILENTA